MLFTCAGLVLTSCDSSDDNDEVTIAHIEDVKSTVSTGDWQITLYEKDGMEQTQNFTGYSFTFDAAGQLTAVNGDTSISGAWSVSADADSSDDDTPSESDVDFTIFFSNEGVFTEISEDWEIVSFSETRLELRDVSDDDSVIDRLIFERI